MAIFRSRVNPMAIYCIDPAQVAGVPPHSVPPRIIQLANQSIKERASIAAKEKKLAPPKDEDLPLFKDREFHHLYKPSQKMWHGWTVYLYQSVVKTRPTVGSLNALLMSKTGAVSGRDYVEEVRHREIMFAVGHGKVLALAAGTSTFYFLIPFALRTWPVQVAERICNGTLQQERDRHFGGASFHTSSRVYREGGNLQEYERLASKVTRVVGTMAKEVQKPLGLGGRKEVSVEVGLCYVKIRTTMLFREFLRMLRYLDGAMRDRDPHPDLKFLRFYYDVTSTIGPYLEWQAAKRVHAFFQSKTGEEKGMAEVGSWDVFHPSFDSEDITARLEFQPKPRKRYEDITKRKEYAYPTTLRALKQLAGKMIAAGFEVKTKQPKERMKHPNLRFSGGQARSLMQWIGAVVRIDDSHPVCGFKGLFRQIDGRWYIVRSDFQTTMQRSFGAVISDHMLPEKSPALLPLTWKKVTKTKPDKKTKTTVTYRALQDEGPYNERYCLHGIPGATRANWRTLKQADWAKAHYMVGDRIEPQKVEVFDLMRYPASSTDPLYLFALKMGFAGDVRVVCNQILVAARRIQEMRSGDCESDIIEDLYRLTVNYPEKKTHRLIERAKMRSRFPKESDFRAVFTDRAPRDIVFVLAFVDNAEKTRALVKEKSRTFKQSKITSVSARLSLCELAAALRRMGFGFRIQQIFHDEEDDLEALLEDDGDASGSTSAASESSKPFAPLPDEELVGMTTTVKRLGVGAGIANHGNTCFLNSCLQLLKPTLPVPAATDKAVALDAAHVNNLVRRLKFTVGKQHDAAEAMQLLLCERSGVVGQTAFESKFYLSFAKDGVDVDVSAVSKLAVGAVDTTFSDRVTAEFGDKRALTQPDFCFWELNRRSAAAKVRTCCTIDDIEVIDPDDDVVNYRPIGVIVHIGDDIDKGHYIAIRKEGGSWSCYDDNKAVTTHPNLSDFGNDGSDGNDEWSVDKDATVVLFEKA